MPESRPKISLTSAPEITIGDINDITGTIADKDRFVLDTSGNRIDPATEGTLSNLYNKVNTIWTRNTIVVTSGTTVLAGSNYVALIDTIPAEHTGAIITVRLTYNASATAGATINTYYSPDGTYWDTEPVDSFSLPFTAGTTIQKSYIVAAPCKGLEIEIVNNDSSYDLTIDYLWLTTIP